MDSTQTLRLKLTTIGALIGGAVAFIWSDLLNELLIVLGGAALGWIVFYGLAVAVRLAAKEAIVHDRAVSHEADRTKDDLYAEAQRLNIVGRGEMTKAELAEAVARHRVAG